MNEKEDSSCILMGEFIPLATSISFQT